MSLDYEIVEHVNYVAGYLRLVHRVALEALEKSKRVIIWGNSLDLYDAELCVLLGESHRTPAGKNQEYFVIDPSDIPVRRLKCILGGGTVHHVNPFSFSHRVAVNTRRILHCLTGN
jgi:hypothetical protein